MTSKPLGQIFKSMGLISEFDVQEALQVQKDKGGAIGKILMDQGQINEQQLSQGLGIQSGMEVVDLDGTQIPAEVIAIVPTADRQKATVRVRIGFLERDERVLRH